MCQSSWRRISSVEFDDPPREVNRSLRCNGSRIAYGSACTCVHVLVVMEVNSVSLVRSFRLSYERLIVVIGILTEWCAADHPAAYGRATMTCHEYHIRRQWLRWCCVHESETEHVSEGRSLRAVKLQFTREIAASIKGNFRGPLPARGNGSKNAESLIPFFNFLFNKLNSEHVVFASRCTQIFNIFYDTKPPQSNSLMSLIVHYYNYCTVITSSGD